MKEDPRAGPTAVGYEEIRERLARRGYLNRPLQRYFFAAIAGPGSFVRRHTIVSLKAALAAGPLLGVVFALAVVWVGRPRFSHPAELLVLAVYFSALLGAAVLALEFAAGLVLAALVRWRGKGVKRFHATAARAGFAVSLAMSAYLALWWRRRTGGGQGTLVDLAGLAVLVAVNLALLRVLSAASLAALVRASELLPADEGENRESRRALGLAALAATGLLTVGYFLAPTAAPASQIPPFERLPAEGRLVVIAWDGASERLLRDLGGEAAPGLPARLLAGTVLARLKPTPADWPPSRPSFWTSVATGREAEEHGVGEIAERRVFGLTWPLGRDAPLALVLRSLVPGRRVAVSAGVRRVPALWEIMAQGEGAGVVGWWATWPAGAQEGAGGPAVVSDRALFAMGEDLDDGRRVAPPGLARALSASRGDDLARARRGIDALPLDALPPPARERLTRAALIDGYATALALRLLEDEDLRVLFLYLPGLDIVRAGGGRDGGSGGEPGFAAALSGGHAMERIADIERRLHPEDWLVLIGDPGRAGLGEEPATGSGRSVHGAPARSAASSGTPRRAEAGWVLISGPGVRRELGGTIAADTPVWSVLDLAPTLLDLRGFPLSREMKGEPRRGFLTPLWQERPRPAEIASYGENPRPALPVADEASERESLERLRSLGYVE